MKTRNTRFKVLFIFDPWYVNILQIWSLGAVLPFSKICGYAERTHLGDKPQILGFGPYLNIIMTHDPLVSQPPYPFMSYFETLEPFKEI